MKKYAIILLAATLMVIFLAETTLAEGKIYLEYFYSEGCPTCATKTPIIDQIELQYRGKIIVKRYDISQGDNYKRWISYGFYEIPAVVIDNETKIPNEKLNKTNLENIIISYLSGEEINITKHNNTLNLPIFGKINSKKVSLILLTIVFGGLDSFNPCAFFVLLVLLNLLLYANSKRRMLLIGSIFVFFSGFIYFLFMLALFGVFYGIFLITEQHSIISVVVGSIALVIGGLNVKDFFYLKKGPSASIPNSKKQKLFKRMRKIVNISYLPSMIIGTIALAVFANTYELFCTMMLPVIYTSEVLPIYGLSIHSIQSYLYILLYNIVYVIPLMTIVAFFIITLGRKKLTEWQGRVLKLLSGNMMISLGLILVVKPNMLSNIIITIMILAIVIIATLTMSMGLKKLEQKS